MASNRYPGVFKRGKTWSYRAQFGDGEDRWGVSGSGYPSAKAAFEAKVEAVRRARPLEGPRAADITLSDYLDAWLENHTATLRESTRSTYLAKVRKIQETEAAGRRLRSLTETDYRRLVAELRGQAPSHTTLKAKVTILAVALNAAVRAGLIDGHPLDRINVSRDHEKFTPGHWSVDTVRTFLEHRRLAKDPLAHVWHLAVVTGLRRGELHGLRWADVDLDAGVLYVRRQRTEVRGTVIETAPKNEASEAPVHLDEETVAMLRSIPRTSEYIVNDPRTGQPYKYIRLFTRDWVRAQEAAMVPPIRFHDLRHTSASLLADAGVPLVLAQQRLRHWSPSMTERYTHALEGSGQEVARRIGAVLGGA